MSHSVVTQIDRNITTPLHMQLQYAIKCEILSGVFKVGEQIPPEREISKAYNVSRITARRALADLEAKGFLTRMKGKGTFVADRYSKGDLTYALGVGLRETSFLFQPSFSMILSGMAEVATQESFNIQLIVTEGAPECAGRSFYERVLDQRRVDGLALIDHQVGDDEILGLHDCDVPIVLFDRVVPGHDLNSVLVDNRGGIFQSVEYLHGLGHHDIGLVIPNINLGYSFLRERYEGYRSALEILGIEFHPEWVIQYSDINKDVEANLCAFMDRKTKRFPTAFVCGEDLAAIRTQELLHKLGYKVPEDFSVMGFDNIPQSAYCVLPITTVDSGLIHIGREMARLLIAEITSQPVSNTRQVSRAQLIVRETTGPVPVR